MKIRKINIALPLILICIVFLSSCSQQKDKEYKAGVSVADVTRKYEDLEAEDVIVSVNGCSLTVQDYIKLLRNCDIIYGAAYKDQPPQKARHLIEMNKRQQVVEFITNRAVLEEADRLDLLTSEASFQQVLNFYKSVAEKGGYSFKEFAGLLGYDTAAFEDKIRGDDALRIEMRKQMFPEPIVVSDEELQLELKRYADYNEMCTKTNELVVAKAQKICKELQSGADFSEYVEKFNEVKEDDPTIWGEFTRPEIEDLEVRNAAFTLPVGGVSQPIDTDEGLVIIKVLGKESRDDEQFESFSEVAVLNRIVLRLGRIFPVPDPEELRAHMLQKKKGRLYMEELAKLREKCYIEYPNGTNLWDRAKGNRLQ